MAPIPQTTELGQSVDIVQESLVSNVPLTYREEIKKSKQSQVERERKEIPTFEQVLGHAMGALDTHQKLIKQLALENDISESEALQRLMKRVLLLQTLKKFQDNTPKGEANRALIIYDSMPQESKELLTSRELSAFIPIPHPN